MKKLIAKYRNDSPHWVGDGFPVRTIFNYIDHARELSPFLMMDYAGPVDFPPSEHIRGVGEHPHRGFETVTIVYSGEVEHRDSNGGGGLIGPGDVQWMTAASGLVHEEKHGKDFAARGGTFEMVQLWVNLPAKDKMSPPRYQGIKKQDIPEIALDQDAGKLRLIAGSYGQLTGPAGTFSPINLWDIRIHQAKNLELKVPPNHTSAIFVLSGKIQFPDGNILESADLGLLERSSDTLSFTAVEDSKLLFLGGEPINEAVIGHGPFVMNTQSEIAQAFQDYRSGKMGRL